MMNVDANLVELLSQGLPWDMLINRYKYDDEQIENALLYLRTTPPQRVYEMLEEDRFLREEMGE